MTHTYDDNIEIHTYYDGSRLDITFDNDSDDAETVMVFDLPKLTELIDHLEHAREILGDHQA